jgi:CRISPR-associated protein Cmr5
MDSDTIKGIEQGRVKFAYNCVEDVKDNDEATKYKAYVKKLPMLIKTNGLGATLAFVKAKSNKKGNEAKAYKEIYDQLTEWLKEDKKQIITLSNDLVETVIGQNSQIYRTVTIELLALISWLSRFAEGLIEGDEQE